MFLFLSKLLPLLIYPLGLVSILLGLALFWWRRSPRRSRIAIATALAILLLSSNSWVAIQLVRTLEWRYQPLDPVPMADAIVVLGGSTHPATPPRPWVEVSEAGDRVLYGVRLYQMGKAPLIIFSGGRIDWKNGGPPEANDMTQIALAMGVPRKAIVQEGRSFNTYENALNVKAILQNRQIQHVLLVTSAMHMPRSLAIFQKQGIDVIPAPTDYWVSAQSLPELTSTWQGRLLHTLPDAEPIYFFTRALKEYIGFLIYRLKGWV